MSLPSAKTLIQLMFNTQNIDEVRAHYTTLFKWQRGIHKAANLVLTHHFVMMNMKELIYLHEKTKVRLANYGKDENGVLNTSKHNSTYQLLSDNFKGVIPATFLNALNIEVVAAFNEHREDYYTGKRAIQSYPSSIHIPFLPADITNIVMKTFKSGGDEYKSYQFDLHSVPLKAVFSARNSELCLFQDLVVGKRTLLSPAIELQEKKIFLSGCFIPKKTAKRSRSGSRQ